MRFREVLPAVCQVIEAQRWPRPQHDITVVRDLHGRVRVVVRSHDPQTAQLPQPHQREQLRDALTAAIGDWLGAEEPVWCPRAPQTRSLDMLFAELDARRRQFPGTILSNLWLVERHTAKQAWAGELAHDPPWSMDDVDAGEAPAVVVFFSHKGGVGRTTALTATALHLARAGQRVALVDLDLEAPGLGSMLLAAAPDYGIVDYLIDQPRGVPGAILDVVALVTDPQIIGDGQALRVLTAGRVDEGYVEMLARLDLQNASAQGGLRQRLTALFTELRQEHDLDFILVDARAGIHDLGGVMLASLCHGAVVVGLDTEQSWQGIRAVSRILAAPVADGRDPVPLVLVQGMGPPAGAPGAANEVERFRDEAYTLLCEDYHPIPPAPGDTQQPHWAEVIRWRTELRGGGRMLADEVVRQLLGDDYRALAARVARLYGRPIDAGAAP